MVLMVGLGYRVPMLTARGRFEDYTYLGMEILGENHSELRRRRIGFPG